MSYKFVHMQKKILHSACGRKENQKETVESFSRQPLERKLYVENLFLNFDLLQHKSFRIFTDCELTFSELICLNITNDLGAL